MRRKVISLFLALLVVCLVLSCKAEVLKDGENINSLLYPYLEFTLSEDGSYYTAEVIENVRLERVEIPAAVDNLGLSIPVRWFKGFKNKEDGKNLKVVILNSGETNIVSDAISNSLSLVRIEMNVGKTNTRWPNLPILDNTSEKEFKGWYIDGTETEIKSGEIVNRRNPKITPAWGEHTLTHVEGKAPTCLEDGWSSYDVCSTCSYNTKKVIPALGHNIVLREEVAPTCTEKGTRKHYECTNCHLLFSDEKGENIIIEITIPSLGHSLSIHEEKEEANCIKEGHREYWQCERCKEYFLSDDPNSKPIDWKNDIVLPKNDHTYSTEWSHDTNNHYHICSVCGSKIDSSVEKHIYTKKTFPPTETESGKTVYTCSTCSYFYVVPIHPNGHLYDENSKVEIHTPTCTERGFTRKYCSYKDCDYYKDDNFVEALNHKDAKHHSEKPATCTEEGNYEYWYCPDCKKYFLSGDKTTPIEKEKTILPKLGHQFSLDWDYDGNEHFHKCIRCDAKKDKESHKLSNYSDSKFIKADATCTEATIYFKSCKCGYNPETETFISGSPLGHDLEKVDEVKSTCMAQGHKAYWKCKRSCCQENNFYDEKGNRINESTLLLPLADHEIIRYDLEGEYHYPVCKLHGRLSGEKHNSDGKASDKDYHWTYCTVCKNQNEKHKHTFILVGKDTKCSECGYKAKDDDKSDSGFDVGVDYQTPDGSISYSKDGESVTVTFRDESVKEEYKATEISWYLDNVLQEENGEVYTFSAPYQRYYSVRCSFTNKFGRGNSKSLSIFGGSN